MTNENMIAAIDALGAMLQEKDFEIVTKKIVIDDLRKKLEAAEEKITKLQAEKDGVLCARGVGEITE